MVKIGSLFSGAGGLDMAVAEVFGGTIVWHSEIDKAASKVLAYRFPDVPNLGDITAVGWDDVPAVDVLCGGFPCQDVSTAGKRAGIKDGTRSGLWAIFADAIDALRPQVVIIENVRGLLSATAHRDMESDDAVMGDRAGGPVLRAAGAVLGDLADLWYCARWATVSAASVGAPHRRERVFIVATIADTSGNGRDERRPEPARLPRGFDAAVSGDAAGQVELLPTPRASDPANTSSHSSEGFRPQLGQVVRQLGGERRDELGEVVDDDGAVPILPGDGGSQDALIVTSDGDGVAVDVCGAENSHSTYVSEELAGTKCDLLPRPAASDGARGPDYAATQRNSSSYHTMVTLAGINQWGKYAAAIARWEHVAGPAPAPTEPNRNNKPRLNPAFSEWMMGWPAGWVTESAIGISRNDQLKVIGNGVCSQQAIAALRYLLAVTP